MKTSVKSFNELSVSELYEILYLRNLVFVIEQNCVYLDTDKTDHLAHHVSIYDGITLAAYARIFPENIKYPTASIGRVIVHPDYRGTSLGHDLMHAATQAIATLYHTSAITISAQAHLQRFYSKHSFVTVSSEYLEDDIPHVEMKKA